MHYLYQIVTSAFAYTLYEEDYYPVLHITNLDTEETKDIIHTSEILDILTFDQEVSPEDYDMFEELVSVCRHY